MLIKDYFEFAVRNEYDDLYILIMFLVYEKKVLSFDDLGNKLNFYLQSKFHERMNNHLKEYKTKINHKHKPCVYEVSVKHKKYKKVYILAASAKQATSFCISQMYEPDVLYLCSIDRLMTKYNNKNEPVNLTVKQLREQATTVPQFLGGY